MPKKKGFEKLAIQFNTFADNQAKNWSRSRFAGQVTRLLQAPINILLSPIALAYNIAGSAPRGYGIPEFISKLSYASVFAIATLGTYDVALDLGKKLVCQRDCNTCSGWQAMRCTMCKGSGRVHYQVKSSSFRRGEKATAEYVADAIVDNRAEIVHLPSSVDFHTPLPSKECPSCDGSGVMSCPQCKNKLQVTISADDLMEPPWRAYNVMRKLEYPYEHIVHSMKDPSIAAFWLLTFPQVVGGFEFDEDVKQRIWWQYKESMRYDQLRDEVAKREPGWEYMQEALVSLDPVRARDDPAVVKNIPFFKAKKALESEVTKLNPPPRPRNWGELELPLSTSSWSEEELKDPNKFKEMTVLLKAQKEIADRLLDEQWQVKWRQEKLNEMLEEKVRPFVEEIDNGELSRPIIIQQGQETQDQKRESETRKRKWWFF